MWGRGGTEVVTIKVHGTLAVVASTPSHLSIWDLALPSHTSTPLLIAQVAGLSESAQSSRGDLALVTSMSWDDGVHDGVVGTRGGVWYVKRNRLTNIIERVRWTQSL